MNTVTLAGRSGNINLAFDTVGWVLVWVGLWFPLDTMLFSPLTYGRENACLALIRDAEVVVEPRHAQHHGLRPARAVSHHTVLRSDMIHLGADSVRLSRYRDGKRAPWPNRSRWSTTWCWAMIPT